MVFHEDSNALPLSDATHTRIVADGGCLVMPTREIATRLGVDSLARLPIEEFVSIKSMSHYVHFNLERTSNKIGKRYAVVPIVEKGFRNFLGTEILPLIDTDFAHCGVCLDVQQGVPIEDVGECRYAYSLPYIRNVAALRETLLARYSRMYPLVSPDDLISRGCAITLIRFD